jgi:hypothetical protein
MPARRGRSCVIDTHPVVDRNKRIGSVLFLHYLLALPVAEITPKHKGESSWG